MNRRVTEFLDNVCIHIKCKSVHKDIRKELNDHIEDLKDEFQSAGHGEDSALELALSAMGDTDQIGNELNKQHRPKTEWSLILLTAVIILTGCIVMYSSSKYESHQAVNFSKYLLSLAAGTAVVIGLYFFDYTKLKKLSLPIYFITFASLVFTNLYGYRVNGVAYLVVFGNALSSDYAVLLYLIAFTGFIEMARGKGGKSILVLGGAGILSVIPIMNLPNLTQAVIMLIGYTFLIICAVKKHHFGGNKKFQWKSLCLAAFVGISFIGVFILKYPYRINRLSGFFIFDRSSPFNYSRLLAEKWLNVSEMFGKTSRTVEGFQIESMLEGVNTHYAFVNVIATLGWVVGIALAIIIALFIIRMFITTMKLKNGYGYFLSMGVSTVLTLQFIIGLLINFNISPFISITIPFISYGNVSFIVNLAYVGIILSVWRRNNLITAHQSLSDKEIVK